MINSSVLQRLNLPSQYFGLHTHIRLSTIKLFTMQYNTNLASTFCQVQRAYNFPDKPLSQRPKFQAPLKGTFHADVPPNPILLHLTGLIPTSFGQVAKKDITKNQRSTTLLSGPVEYTLNDGPRDVPGTAAYYKSWAFRKKVNAGTNQVPGRDAGHGKSADKDSYEHFDKASTKTYQTKSLVVISSRTNARRASTQRKVDKRIQKANRRM